ncbi:MAG: hypothetical protein R3F48_03355 [Candidatus Zixiibacteriota bacterium]
MAVNNKKNINCMRLNKKRTRGKMKIIKGEKIDRIEYEYNCLIENIPADTYVIFKKDFPEFTPMPGTYKNNIGIFTRLDYNSPINVDGQYLIGPAIEICYIRDDREKADDPSTKHINVDYRILGKSIDGHLVQGNYRKDDHFISPVNATSMGYIEENRNLTELGTSGTVSYAYNAGIKFKLYELQKDNK